jgi:hypothetical protein
VVLVSASSKYLANFNFFWKWRHCKFNACISPRQFSAGKGHCLFMICVTVSTSNSEKEIWKWFCKGCPSFRGQTILWI